MGLPDQMVVDVMLGFPELLLQRRILVALLLYVQPILQEQALPLVVVCVMQASRELLFLLLTPRFLLPLVRQ